uniref:Insulin receptor substrate 1 n=1 Tax=Lepeophtheirus salmonis TaxID=72036 RepID=A0A0K2SXT9_LEPSM
MYGKETLILSKKETSRTIIPVCAQRKRGMSWAEKRISLPSFLYGGNGHNSGHHVYQNSESDIINAGRDSSSNNMTTATSSSRSNNNTGESVRNIKKNLVLTASLRKLKKNKLKWFVLYQDEPGDPNNTAYLEYHDDDKKWKAGFPPKRVIVLNKCLNICRKQDSRDSKNKKVIALYTSEDCVSLLFEQEEELRIWLDLLLSHQQGRNSNGKIPKPNYEYMWQVKVRNFQPESKNSQFTMTGIHRLCVTSDDVKFFPYGTGEPIVFPVDCIRNCGTVNRHFRLETGRSSVSGPGLLIIECEDREIANNINVRVLSSMRESETVQHGTNPRSAPHYNSQRHGCSNSSRPRAESWSNHEKTTAALPSSAPNSSIKFPISGSFVKDSMGSSKSSLSSNMRHRTTSEGGHFEIHKNRRPLISSSPNSPGPGSFLCSSESAGSSNSIEDAYNDGKHLFSSITPDANHIADSTIYEESSGESAQDVDRSNVTSSFLSNDIKKLTTTGSYISKLVSENDGYDSSYALMGPIKSSDDYMDMSSVPHENSTMSSSFNRLTLTPSLDLTSPTSTSSSYHPNNDDNNQNNNNNDGDYLMRSPPSQPRASEDMNIPLSEDFSSSYVTMSPVSLDIDKLKAIEEEETIVPPTSRLKILGNHHHRNSYCSSTEETPRWSPGPPHLSDPYHSSPHLPIDPDFPMDPESNYVPLDFRMIDRNSSSHHHHDSRRRISPASSCSIISVGTPSSSAEMHQPDKVVSQIIRDEELEDLLLPRSNNNNIRNSSRTYSMGSRPEKQVAQHPSLPPLPVKSSSSRNGSNSCNNSSRFIDIPIANKSSSSLNNPNNTPVTHHWLKQSPGSSTGNSPSSIMSWIRQRTGSVPSRPPFFERKRHRTQSEGEKDDA